jgi:hypothetical protein
MANAAFSDFLPEISHLIAGCPEPTAINAVRNATIEFCTRTNVWQETQDAVTLTATDFPYTLEALTGATVVTVLDVSVEGRSIDPTTIDALDKNSYNWRANTGPMPEGYYQPNPDEVVLYPALSEAKSVVFRVSYAPTRAATGVVDHIYQIHLEAIAAGALARLMAIPMQPWSNPKMALYYSSVFNTAKNSAAMDVNKSFTRAPVMIQMRRFA